MRRFIAIPLILLYLVSISGAMVQLHFCNQKVSSWAINSVVEEEDDCCEKEEIPCHKNNVVQFEEQTCCSDQTVIVKTVDQVSPPSFEELFFSAPAIIPQNFTLPDFHLPHSLAVNVFFDANAPPGLWQDIPLFKLHHRFTYYG